MLCSDKHNKTKRPRPWDRSLAPMALFSVLLVLFLGICNANEPENAQSIDETVRYLKSLSLEELAGIDYVPSERTLDLFSIFTQDRITLVEDRPWLTVGARFENGCYTDWEVQPTGRLSWRPREAHTIWAAVSGAVRTPSRMEKDGRHPDRVLPPGAAANPTSRPLVIQRTGTESFTSEKLTAYEAGYRFQPSERLFCDLTIFYNDYRDLYSAELSGSRRWPRGRRPA
ncbi:MAG: TonB-dependent receptor [Desulfobacterales bacterium]|nr:TonB-dependent receptor [Desulfobacterales bacterium]